MAKRERELACKGRKQSGGGGEVFCSSEFLDTLLVLVTLEVSFLFFYFLFTYFWDIIIPKVSLFIFLLIIITHNSTCVEAQGHGKV